MSDPIFEGSMLFDKDGKPIPYSLSHSDGEAIAYLIKNLKSRAALKNEQPGTIWAAAEKRGVTVRQVTVHITQP